MTSNYANESYRKMKTQSANIFLAHDNRKFFDEEECKSYELSQLSKGCHHLTDEQLVALILLLTGVSRSDVREIRVSQPSPALQELIAEHAIYFEMETTHDQSEKYAGLLGGRNDFQVIDIAPLITNRSLKAGWLVPVRQVFEFLETECQLFLPSDKLMINPKITSELILIYKSTNDAL